MQDHTETRALGAMIETIELRSTSPRVFLEGQERSAIEAIRQRARRARRTEPPTPPSRSGRLGWVCCGLGLMFLALTLM